MLHNDRLITNCYKM